jgi:hypothetical protein
MPRKFSADVVAINVRLPKKLHKRLEQLAKRNSSSINTEMVVRLERSIQTDNWPVEDLPLLLLQELAAIRGRMRLDNLTTRLREGIAALGERESKGDYLSKRLTGLSAPDQEGVGQLPQKEHKPRPGRREA